MAFEAFLQTDDARPRWRRRVTLTISLLVHAGALAAAVAYSFWHVEEITPPTVRVTFLASAPPPPAPPPPPPAGGSAAPKKKTTTTTPKPTLTTLVPPHPPQPKKNNKHTPPTPPTNPT